MAIRPQILFNTSTGSDTAASGAGPATALSGTGAAITSASADVDLSADAPDLSAVATDGSAAIWVDSSTGRQWGRITAVNDGTKVVTAHGTFGATEGSRNWGIGGKRNTLDAASNRRILQNDGEAEWGLILDDQQDLTSAITTTLNPFFVRSSVVGTLRVIRQTADVTCFIVSAAAAHFIDIQIKNSSVAKTIANGFNSAGGGTNIFLTRCILGDPSGAENLRTGYVRIAGTQGILVLTNSNIVNCVEDGISNAAFAGGIYLFGSSIIGCGGNGYATAASFATSHTVFVSDSVLAFNGGRGLEFGTSGGTNLVVLRSVIHGNDSDGLELPSGPILIVANNAITANGGFGIISQRDRTLSDFIDYNNFGTGATANTSGTHSGIAAGDNDVSLDPQFVDADNLDFTTGANMQAIGWPTEIFGTLTPVTFDIGPQQECAASGGSGATAFAHW